jgi:ankyrin repeat protein
MCCGMALCHNTRTQNEWTALTFSAWNGHTECVRLLLDAGASMETQDSVRIGCVA